LRKLRSPQRGPKDRVAPPLPETDAGGDLPTSDHVYGLVSVLYHALQGAETYQLYIDDAQRGGDQELVKFFQECKEEERERAERAKALLTPRIETKSRGEDDEEEDEDDQDDEDDEDEA